MAQHSATCRKTVSNNLLRRAIGPHLVRCARPASSTRSGPPGGDLRAPCISDPLIAPRYGRGETSGPATPHQATQRFGRHSGLGGCQCGQICQLFGGPVNLDTRQLVFRSNSFQQRRYQLADWPLGSQARDPSTLTPLGNRPPSDRNEVCEQFCIAPDLQVAHEGGKDAPVASWNLGLESHSTALPWQGTRHC